VFLAASLEDGLSYSLKDRSIRAIRKENTSQPRCWVMNRPDICQSEDGEEHPGWPSSREVANIQPLPASSFLPLPQRSRPGLLRYLRRFHSTWYGQPCIGTTAFVDTSVTFALGVSNTSWVDELMWERPVCVSQKKFSRHARGKALVQRCPNRLELVEQVIR
jgi:hypothetical protein